MDPPQIIQRPLDDAGSIGERDSHYEDDQTSVEHHRFVIPEDRKLGFFSTSLLIVNRMIGTGIFSTPSTIMQATDSVGASLLFWILGGVITSCGLFAYLELGMSIPRSGGEKVYLERIYRRPKYLAICIFAVQFVFLSISAANTVNFSQHIIRAVKGTPDEPEVNCGLRQEGGLAKPSGLDSEWVNKGISLSVITAVSLVHGLMPKLGIWISNGLGVFKLGMLGLIVCTGFAALSGNLRVPKPNNFSSFRGPGMACDVPPYEKSMAAANYAIALLQVLYSYQGWESANYVLSEVRHAPKTLKRAAPIAVLVVTILYVLANVSYFAASTKSEIANSGVTVAAGFFQHVYGPGKFVNIVLPIIISLSSLGNVFSQTFSNSRAKQELAKEGILPFSRLWASDWPFQAPTGGLLLHWLFTSIMIIGPGVSDAYTFLSILSTYAISWIKVFIAIGLLYLTYSRKENWRSQRSELHAWPATTMFWLCSLAFVVITPFIRNTTVTPSIPWYVIPTVGTATLAVGALYWLVWAKLRPTLGYAIQHEVEELPDGSQVVRFVHVRQKRPESSRMWGRNRKESYQSSHGLSSQCEVSVAK